MDPSHATETTGTARRSCRGVGSRAAVATIFLRPTTCYRNSTPISAHPHVLLTQMQKPPPPHPDHAPPPQECKVMYTLHLPKYFSSLRATYWHGSGSRQLKPVVLTSEPIVTRIDARFHPGGSYVSTQRNRPAPRALHILISSRLRRQRE